MTIIGSKSPVAPDVVAPPGEVGGEVTEVAPPTRWTKKRKGMVAALVIALVALAALFAWYLNTGKPLTQLPGLSVAKVPHYQFSIYGVSRPQGVVATPSGDRIYVSESDGDRVVKIFDQKGQPMGTLKPPASTGASHTPVYLAINPVTNDVYVSDRFTKTVYVYDQAGKYLRTFVPSGNLGGGWSPMGLAFGKDGTLYATDVSGKDHRVLVFSPDGTLLRSMVTPAAPKLVFPNGIAVDARGNVEVSDGNNSRLVVFDPAGKMLATINAGVGEGDLGLPRGVAVDDSSRLLVVDSADHMVRVYDVSSSKVATPTYIGSFGSLGQLDGQFQYPNGISTDTRAHVYVTDRDNNRLQVWGY